MLLSSHSLVDPALSRGSQRRDSSVTGPAIIREIAACLDGSELGSGIVPHAQMLARAFGARLTLLRVLEAETADAMPVDALDWGIRYREAKGQLADLEAELGEMEPGVRVVLIQGRAAEQICAWAAKHDIDITVLCSHGKRGVTEWDLASTARKIIDRAPGSLLLVPAAAAGRQQAVHYRRILVPLDGSPRAESVAPLAMRIAQAEEGAEVLFAHVVPVPEITCVGPLDAAGAELEERVTEYNRRVASAHVDRVRARSNQAGVHVRAKVVRDGNVRTRLDRLIRDEGVDLVVMSAHGRTGPTGSPCGSVAAHALTHATTPILMVRDVVHRCAQPFAPRRVATREQASSTL
jgi:nucleotide-binding universal stress UspA family protein